MYHANFAGWLATIGLSCPIFWNIRRTLPPSGVTGKLSKICGFISQLSRVKIFCNSFSGIESHVISGYRRDSFIYAPNGFDSNDFSNNSIPCEEIGVSKSDINVVCVGRYDPIKGHRFLIEAFALLENMLPSETWSRLKLHFVGREIENAKDVQDTLNRSRLDRKVKFLGEREDIKRLLHCFDIFCLPSLSEGFPNVLVEAMLAGLPCVATNAGDTARILRSDEFVSEPGDSAVMAEKLRNLIVAGESFRLSIGEKNKDLVLERYTMEKALACYESYYRASIGAGSAS
jgi:glycosyltransferase involved in cell wall biosynthesis